MTPKKENKFTIALKGWLTPALVFGGIVYFAYFGGNALAVMKTLMFQDVEQRIKTKSHINSDYNEVKNHQLGERLKEMEIQFDTAFVYIKQDLDASIAMKKADSVNSANAIKSRALRDTIISKAVFDINNIKRDQTIQTNTNQLILQELRKLKQMIDTIN